MKGLALVATAVACSLLPLRALPADEAALAARELLVAGTEAEGIRPSALQRAAALLDEAIARGEPDARVLALRGHVAVKQRDADAGQRWLARARALAPADGWVLYLVAEAERTRDPDGAAALFDAALVAGIPFVLEARAAMLEAMPRALRARDRVASDRLFAQWTALEPERAEVVADYAKNVMMHFGDFTAGERLARRALAIEDSAAARRHLSLALYGQWASAVRDGAAPSVVARAWNRADAFDPGARLLPECEARLPAVAFIYSSLDQQPNRRKETFRC